MNRYALLGLGLAIGGAFILSAGGSSSLPKGKGVFIIDLPSQGPEYLIERLRYLGIQWVAIEIAWYGPPGPPSSYDALGRTHNMENGRLAAFVPELTAAGIQCWVWGYPAPDRIPAFVDNVKDAYQAAPALSGVIIDPEEPWYGAQHGPALEDIISRLKGLGRPVGLSSYGRPSYHPTFPWRAIGGVDFGMPQIYSELGAGYPPKADQEWRSFGVPYIVPLNGASSAHEPAAITQQAAWSVTQDGAIGWWTYHHAVGNSGRADAIRGIRVSHGQPAYDPATPPSSPSTPSSSCSMASLRDEYKFRFWATGGASWGDGNPTVILYHGLGSKPSAWPQFIDTTKPAKFVAARGFNAYGAGRAWWPTKAADPDQTKLANQMQWAGTEARKLIADLKRCAGGPLFLAGHSQGGMMALIAGALSLTDVETVIAGSAWLPASMQHYPLPPTYMIHGDDDTTVDYQRTKSWAEDAPGITWISVDGGHQLVDEVRGYWAAALEASL